MFSYCKNLDFFPNIFKWKIKRPTNLRGTFNHCMRTSRPKDFNFTPNQINNQCRVEYLFYYCDNFLSCKNKDVYNSISDYFNIGFKCLDAFNARDLFSVKLNK